MILENNTVVSGQVNNIKNTSANFGGERSKWCGDPDKCTLLYRYNFLGFLQNIYE